MMGVVLPAGDMACGRTPGMSWFLGSVLGVRLMTGNEYTNNNARGEENARPKRIMKNSNETEMT